MKVKVKIYEIMCDFVFEKFNEKMLYYFGLLSFKEECFWVGVKVLYFCFVN